MQVLTTMQVSPEYTAASLPQHAPGPVWLYAWQLLVSLGLGSLCKRQLCKCCHALYCHQHLSSIWLGRRSSAMVCGVRGMSQAHFIQYSPCFAVSNSPVTLLLQLRRDSFENPLTSIFSHPPHNSRPKLKGCRATSARIEPSLDYRADIIIRRNMKINVVMAPHTYNRRAMKK